MKKIISFFYSLCLLSCLTLSYSPDAFSISDQLKKDLCNKLFHGPLAKMEFLSSGSKELNDVEFIHSFSNSITPKHKTLTGPRNQSYWANKISTRFYGSYKRIDMGRKKNNDELIKIGLTEEAIKFLILDHPENSKSGLQALDIEKFDTEYDIEKFNGPVNIWGHDILYFVRRKGDINPVGIIRIWSLPIQEEGTMYHQHVRLYQILTDGNIQIVGNFESNEVVLKI
ncbi:MAG: hypothetical protein H6622_17795 [Halobacteriovoraceae bacterium]|nr:hypothetical protein [Halobacteriovoraceae bacterium]